MEKNLNLPLYDEFMDIFANHEIQNWQAKHFWEKMRINKSSHATRFKPLMYSGIRVLVECEYLRVDWTQSTRKTFSYTETSRLKNLRDKYKKQRLEEVFFEKKTKLLDLIKDKENNILFLESLLSEDETLDKCFINYQKKLKNEIKNINSNIRLMDSILSK